MARGLETGMCCVHCGASISEVYVQYSPGNIRLTKCTECKRVADEYVECEMMIILIDLILHKPEAYRHLFFNNPKLNKLNIMGLIVKTSLLFIILDSYKQSLLTGPEKVDAVKWDSFLSFISSAGKLVGLVLIQNVVFFLATLLTSQFLVRNHLDWRLGRWMDILHALLLSSYFKLFTFAMMVWEFSPFMMYIVEMFVLSSNTIALKVMMNSTTPIAATIVAVGFLARCMVSILL